MHSLAGRLKPMASIHLKIRVFVNSYKSSQQTLRRVFDSVWEFWQFFIVFGKTYIHQKSPVACRRNGERCFSAKIVISNLRMLRKRRSLWREQTKRSQCRQTWNVPPRKVHTIQHMGINLQRPKLCKLFARFLSTNRSPRATNKFQSGQKYVDSILGFSFSQTFARIEEITVTNCSYRHSFTT